MTIKEQVLLEIKKTATTGNRANFNFSKMSKDLGIKKEDLDTALNELEKDRDITQFTIANNDDFIILLN